MKHLSERYKIKLFAAFLIFVAIWTGSVTVSAAARPETPVLSGTAAGNRVTLTWNKVKKASGYQIFL